MYPFDDDADRLQGTLGKSRFCVEDVSGPLGILVALRERDPIGAPTTATSVSPVREQEQLISVQGGKHQDVAQHHYQLHLSHLILLYQQATPE